MKKPVAAAMAVLVLGVLFAAPALAKPYFQKPTCELSDTTVSPGDEITVSGENWQQGATVSIILRPEQIVLGTATVGADGSFSITVTIPEDIRPGPHQITCKGRNTKGNVRVQNTTITVLGETVTPPPGTGTASTGASINVPFWAGLAGILVLLGLAALLVARRMRRRPSLS